MLGVLRRQLLFRQKEKLGMKVVVDCPPHRLFQLKRAVVRKAARLERKHLQKAEPT
jgi:hypothetical protein